MPATAVPARGGARLEQPVIVVTGRTGHGKSTTLNYFLSGDGKTPLPTTASKTTAVETVLHLTSHVSCADDENFAWSIAFDAFLPVKDSSTSSDDGDAAATAEGTAEPAKEDPLAEEEKDYVQLLLEDCIPKWTSSHGVTDQTKFDGRGLGALKTVLKHVLAEPNPSGQPFYRVVDGVQVFIRPTRVSVTMPAPHEKFQGWCLIDTVGLRNLEDTAAEYVRIRANRALELATQMSSASAMLVLTKDVDEHLALNAEGLADSCLISNPRRAIMWISEDQKGSKLKVKKGINGMPHSWHVVSQDGKCYTHDERNQLDPETQFPGMMFDRAVDIANIHFWFAAIGAAALDRAQQEAEWEAKYRQTEALETMATCIEHARKDGTFVASFLDEAYRTVAVVVLQEFTQPLLDFARRNGRGWRSVKKALESPFYNTVTNLEDNPVELPLREAARRFLCAALKDHDINVSGDIVTAAIRKIATEVRGGIVKAILDCAQVEGGKGTLSRMIERLEAIDFVSIMCQDERMTLYFSEAVAEAVDDAIDEAYESIDADGEAAVSDTSLVERRRLGHFAYTIVERRHVFKTYFPQCKHMYDKEVAVAKKLKCFVEHGCSPAADRFEHAPLLLAESPQTHTLKYERVDPHDGKDLQAFIGGRASTEQRKKLFALLLESVSGLHECGVAHRDLKPDNVLVRVDAEGAPVSVVLIDFGSCSLGNTEAPRAALFSTKPVSRADRYSAPECMNQDGSAYKLADIYSLRKIGEDLGWALTAGGTEYVDPNPKARLDGEPEDNLRLVYRKMLEAFERAVAIEGGEAPSAAAQPPSPPTPPAPQPTNEGGAPDRDALLSALVEYIEWLLSDRESALSRGTRYRRLLTLIARRTYASGRRNPRSLHAILENWSVPHLQLLVNVTEAIRNGNLEALEHARSALMDELPVPDDSQQGMIYFVMSGSLAYVGKTDKRFVDRYRNGVKTDPATSLPEDKRQQWLRGAQRHCILLPTSDHMPWGACEAAFICILGTLFRLERDGINWCIGGQTDPSCPADEQGGPG